MDKSHINHRPLLGRRRAILTACAITALLGFAIFPAHAAAVQLTGYQIGEQADSPDVDSETTGAAADTDSDTDNGPVRLARFSYIEGTVSWRPDANSDWSDAAVNLPLRPGAQIWVTGQGRAEIQFDDGSYLRLGDSAVATLQTMSSNQDGEFTQINLNDGLASLRLDNDRSMYEVDTEVGAVSASGPAKLRIGSESGLEVAVRDGSAQVETDGGTNSLSAGDYVYLPVADSQFVVDAIPDEDSWDQFNDQRDQTLSQASDPDSEYLPPSVRLVAGDLDDYGQWHADPAYGEVWTPAETDPNWRPYEDGRWVWVTPFGWTWVGAEPWGWAPYHYGTWVDEPWGWSWVPGPARQYWSPAVVHFTQCDGDVAWVALAPADVHYTSISVSGFIGGNWWLHFSIGGCAVYQPAGAYCVPQPWHNGYINRAVFVAGASRPIGPTGPAGPVVAAFVPFNARHGVGVISVATSQFAVAVSYHAASNGADLFRRGQWTPARPGALVAGPAFIHPVRESFTPARTFLPAGQAPSRLGQPVHRSTSPAVARFYGGPTTSGQRFGAPRTSTPQPGGRYGAGNQTGTNPGWSGGGNSNPPDGGHFGGGSPAFGAPTAGGNSASSTGGRFGGSTGSAPARTHTAHSWRNGEHNRSSGGNSRNNNNGGH